MKVLLPNRVAGAFGYITDGWYNALSSIGVDVRRYDNDISKWNLFDPDLYIGCSGHKQQIPKHHNSLIAIHVNPYGPINIKDINEKQRDIDWTIEQKPNVVFGYGFESDRLLWSYWEQKAKIRWVPMPTAGDAILFKDLHKDRPNDLIYLGGRHPYKAISIDNYLIPLISDNRYKSVLRGHGEWYGNLCKGVLAEDQVVDFYNSGKVAPCVSEIHTHKYGIDIPERVWKAALCGCLTIHDPVPSLRDNLQSAIIAKDPQDFRNLIDSNLNSDYSIKKAAQKAEIIKNHTYHHRLSVLFRNIGLDNIADKLIGFINGISN